jgi:hypothetical protein
MILRNQLFLYTNLHPHKINENIIDVIGYAANLYFSPVRLCAGTRREA